jgi:hypothetical protein
MRIVEDWLSRTGPFNKFKVQTPFYFPVEDRVMSLTVCSWNQFHAALEKDYRLVLIFGTLFPYSDLPRLLRNYSVFHGHVSPSFRNPNRPWVHDRLE